MRFPLSKHVSGRLQNLEVSVPVSDRAQVTPTLEVSKSQRWCFRCTDSQKGKPNPLLGHYRLCVMCFSHAGSWSVELRRSNTWTFSSSFKALGSSLPPFLVHNFLFPIKFPALSQVLTLWEDSERCVLLLLFYCVVVNFAKRQNEEMLFKCSVQS